MKKSSIIAYALASGLFLGGCYSNQDVRQVITTNDVNTENDFVTLYYTTSNMHETKTNEKVFEVGEHNLIIKIAATIGYDDFMQIEGPENYRLLEASYVENATGESGIKYGYFVCTFQNIVPVKVIGRLDNEKEVYIYNTPGVAVELEQGYSLELTR